LVKAEFTVNKKCQKLDPHNHTTVMTSAGGQEDGLRPWRKRALQIITTDIWRKDSVEEVVPLKQVAGHGSHDQTQAILTGKDGCILKPIQAPPRGLREKQFYEDVFSSQDENNAKFKPFLPKYFGTCKKKTKNGPAEFLMIENLTQGFEKPCIMDIKIGAKTYGPDANAEKIAKQDASYAGTKKPFGFSVLGMSVHAGQEKKEFNVQNKDYGKSLNVDNITDFLVKYLDSSSLEGGARAVAKLFADKLSPLVTLFSEQTTFHLYGSSLLFVYDASKVVEFSEGKIDEKQLAEGVAVTMIDFAHVWAGEDRIDENYFNGVTNLHKVFAEFSSQ